MAGSKNILELHGNILNVRCSECGTFTETWGDNLESVPRCKKCNGLLRPDVVWFEESLPRVQLDAAINATRTCQVFFSIGTSGVVHPAAALAHAAKAEGAVVVEINAEPTPLTAKVDFAFHGKSGEILPDLVKSVWG
jgi:NAD-dependent deacetylase